MTKKPIKYELHSGGKVKVKGTFDECWAVHCKYENPVIVRVGVKFIEPVEQPEKHDEKYVIIKRKNK